MRIRKTISILIIVGLFVLPFLEISTIQTAQAEDFDPPVESDQTRLDYDDLQEAVHSNIKPEDGDGTELVDLTLGMEPADFLPEVREKPGFDGVDQAEPSTSKEFGNSIESLNYNPVTGLNILDNFNRGDGSLGSDWTVHEGSFSITGEMVVGTGRATYDDYMGDGDSAEADVTATIAPSTQYTGLLLNYGRGDNNLFIKVQQQDASGKFHAVGCYTGNNGSPFGPGFFSLDSPFTTAHMKATRVWDTVTLVFSNIDGGTQPSQTYVCDGAPYPEGNGVGIIGLQGYAKIDNFAVRGGCELDMHDNGPMITHDEGGYGGADASAAQSNALGMITLGWGSQYLNGNRLADDFEVTDPGGWQVNAVTIPAFQIGSTTTPTITGLYYQIWDGPPDTFGSNVVFGDLTTNRLISTVWTGAYRIVDTNFDDVSMPIMANTGSGGVFLPQGTYWLDWMIDGSLASGPWVPPITIPGQTSTGNAEQFVVAWNPVLDAGTGPPLGIPFVIHGCRDNVLWDQPLSTSYPTFFTVSQTFPLDHTLDCFVVDDFFVDQPWSIESLYFPGGWNTHENAVHATEIFVGIFSDSGGLPNVTVWSSTLPINSPNVTLYLNALGAPSDVMVTLPNPFILPPGQYWLGMAPKLHYGSYGYWGRSPSDTINGNAALWINPGGTWSFGTDWQDWRFVGAPT